MSSISLTVTVVGAGTMGQGIAQVVAASGHSTRLVDAAPGRAASAIKDIGAQLAKLVAKGKVTEDARHQTMSRRSRSRSFGRSSRRH